MFECFPCSRWKTDLQAHMLEVEAAYNASWEEASEKLSALIDRLMCVQSLISYVLQWLPSGMEGMCSRSHLCCYRSGCAGALHRHGALDEAWCVQPA